MIVYKYGLLAPTEQANLVREQMRAAHRYRNVLVEIERGRRTAIRSALSAFGDVAGLEQAARAADDAAAEAARAVKAYKSELRTNKVPAELRERLDAARVAKRDALQAWRTTQTAIRTDEQAQLRFDEINNLASDLRKNAYQHSGLYWGTRAIVDDADQAARKAPYFDGVEPSDPGFLRWAGEGSLSMQLQEDPVDGEQGYTRASLEGDNARCQILPRKETCAEGSRRYGRSRTLLLRVGSVDRDPVWASWPMIMHRPLPEGCRVKRVTVHCRRIGPREEWSVTFTVDDSASPRVRANRSGACAINLGWRVVPDGIRILSWVGEDGNEGHVVLDGRTLSGLAKSEELRSLRDETFNAARVALVAWLGEPGRVAPEWLTEATRTLADWRSPARLAALAQRWRTARFEGDGGGYDPLERWRYRDHHLWAWESSQRTGALRHRKDVMRNAAAFLAAKYDMLVCEDFDLRQPARRREADAPRDNETARSNRHAVAPSEMRSALISAFRGAVEKRSASFLTHTCAACGAVESFDAAAEVSHECGGCGAYWDQDLNLARNLLSSHVRERESGAADGEIARAIKAPEKSESRWEKARRLRAEKDARMGTARASSSPAE